MFDIHVTRDIKGLAIGKHDKPFVINKLTERRKIKQNTRLLFGQL